MEFFHQVFNGGQGKQTWLRRGSNCRVRTDSPGKIFRRARGARLKPNKISHFTLARRLQCSLATDQNGSGQVPNG
jgi:hypothetical protein